MICVGRHRGKWFEEEDVGLAESPALPDVYHMTEGKT